MTYNDKPPIQWRALLDWLPWNSTKPKATNKDLKVDQIYRQKAPAQQNLPCGRSFWNSIWYKTENQCLRKAKADLENRNLPLEHPLSIDPWMKVFASSIEFRALAAKFGKEFSACLHVSAYAPYDKIPDVCSRYLKELAELAAPVKDAAGIEGSIAQDDLTPLLILLFVKCDNPKLITDSAIKRLFASVDTAEGSPYRVKASIYEKAAEALSSNPIDAQTQLLSHKFTRDADKVKALISQGKGKEAKSFLEEQKYKLLTVTGPVTSALSVIKILRGIDTKQLFEIGEKYSRPSVHGSLLERLGISQFFSKLLRHS